MRPQDMLRQTSLLILARLQECGNPPSIRELCTLTDSNVNTVWGNLNRLRKLGLVEWEPYKKRTLIATCLLKRS